MVDGGPRFLGDPAEIAVNPSTRQPTLFSILITAKCTAFSGAMYTHPRSEWKLAKFDQSLSAISVWVAGPGNGGGWTMISG